MPNQLSNEKIAASLVKIYFKEIARLGYKRRLTLDETINAYYYALSRLQNKAAELEKARRHVLRDEADLEKETKEDLFPEPGN